jgi:hypothetical protein
MPVYVYEHQLGYCFPRLKRGEKSTIFAVMSLTEECAQSGGTIAESALGSQPIDVSLLDDSLRLTPWQRILENDRALALVRMLEAAKLRADGATEPNS